MTSFKILLLTLLISPLLTIAGNKGKFNLTVNVSDQTDGQVLVRNLTRPLPDTANIVKGTFVYSDQLIEPTPFIVADMYNHYQLFFAAPGDQIVMGLRAKDMQVTSLTGSANHAIFMELINAQEPLQKKTQGLQQLSTMAGKNQDSIQQAMNSINQQLQKNFTDFLSKHGKTEVAAFVVYSSLSNDRTISTTIADSMSRSLSGKGASSFYGKEVNKMVSKLRAVQVGNMAPDFTLPDSTGLKNYTLSKFRGQYVLIDFWASWCGPCKGEIPFLKQAYSTYHSKGFEIISVSLDSKRDAWLAALRQYAMPWIHISDTKGFNSIVNDLYHVPSIPKTLLLDKNGKIIFTDLRGPALEQKLGELLK